MTTSNKESETKPPTPQKPPSKRQIERFIAKKGYALHRLGDYQIPVEALQLAADEALLKMALDVLRRLDGSCLPKENEHSDPKWEVVRRVEAWQHAVSAKLKRFLR